MKCWALTNRGLVRKDNQDCCYARADDQSGSAVLLVCDGMGGANAGNIASATAVEAFTESFAKSEAEDDFDVALALMSAVSSANSKVFKTAASSPEFEGMGTTLVAACISKDDTAVVNIGDSRAYKVTPDYIVQITKDHSVVEDLISRGDITREESRNHPNKNLITRAIGTREDVYCDLFHPILDEGDYLLLCSDGLTNMVSDQEILYEIIHGGDDDSCCERLMNICISRGAPDNVTVVLCKI